MHIPMLDKPGSACMLILDMHLALFTNDETYIILKD
jgi:hypothetical protein